MNKTMKKKVFILCCFIDLKFVQRQYLKFWLYNYYEYYY